MIYPATYFEAKCDHCKDQYQDEYNGFTAYSHESEIQDVLDDAEWHTDDNGNHYCPACYQFNDNDEIELIVNRKDKYVHK